MFRQYKVSIRPFLPFGNQFRQYFRVLFCQIVTFGAVFNHVIQFPFFSFFVADRFPVAPADRSVVLMFPVHIFVQRVCFLLNSREKTASYQWIYFVSTVISFRVSGSCRFQNSRHNVRQITGNTTPFTFLFFRLFFHDTMRGVEIPPS